MTCGRGEGFSRRASPSGMPEGGANVARAGSWASAAGGVLVRERRQDETGVGEVLRRGGAEVLGGERGVDAEDLVQRAVLAAEADEPGEDPGDRVCVVEAPHEAVARVRLGVGETAGRDRLGAKRGEGPEDLVAHGDRVLELLHAGAGRDELRVGARREVREELVDLLLGLDQLLVGVGRRAEGEVEEDVEGRPVLLGGREGGATEGDDDPGERRCRPGDVDRLRSLRRRLRGDLDGVAPALPGAPVLLDEGEDLRRVDVARDDDRRVLGPVPAVEERLRVGELVGHVLDVAEEAHRRVLVGVRREGGLAHRLEQLRHRLRAVLVVLAEDGARLRLERRLGVIEVLEAVRLDLEDLLEVLLGERHVVVRVVVGRVGVLPRAGLRQDRLVGVGRVRLRPAEHHVLEEVGEARLARLHLVA